MRGFGGIGGMLRYTVDFQVDHILLEELEINLSVSVDAMRQLGRCGLRPGRLLSSQNPLYS